MSSDAKCRSYKLWRSALVAPWLPAKLGSRCDFALLSEHRHYLPSQYSVLSPVLLVIGAQKHVFSTFSIIYSIYNRSANMQLASEPPALGEIFCRRKLRKGERGRPT